jgi:sensor domain CHASE-containing protein
MKMRKKGFLFVGLIMTAIFLVFLVVVNAVMLPSYSSLEAKSVDKSLARVSDLISSEITDLNGTAMDWAFWDDTYNFVQNPSQSYVDLNLPVSTFTPLRVNMILFVNRSGFVVYGESIDLENSTVAPLPQGIYQELASEPSLWNFSATANGVQGILQLPEQTMLFSSLPILTSLDQGPSAGTLIMGRYLDSSEIEFLSNAIQLPVAICQFDDSVDGGFQAAHSHLSGVDRTYIEPLNSDTVAGYTLANDVFSNPALMIRVEMPRDIYLQGVTTANYFVAIIGGICLLFGVTTVTLLEVEVISPLSKLTKSVKEIGVSGQSSLGTSRFGNDETAILAQAVKDAISQRLAAIEELGGMIGHDLRNPLTGIKGAAYYLEKKYSPLLDAKGIEMLKIIEDDVAYSNKIVCDLMDYSRRIKLEYIDTNTKVLMSTALSLVEIPKKIEVSDFSDDGFEVTVDSNKLQRVFVSLIKNAVDSMPSGGSLTIKSVRGTDGVSISISDTGIGMSKETLGKIGSPLFTTKAKGMGFGLAISKRIVEAHGGSLIFKSAKGKGTTATVYLPSKGLAPIWGDSKVLPDSLGPDLDNLRTL